MRKLMLSILGLMAAAVGVSSCRAVKPYESQNLKGHYMQANALSIEKLESEADSYREGAEGGLGGRTGGGCGCN